MRKTFLILVLLGLIAVPGPAYAAPGGLLDGKTICLDPGHGGTDPGAVYSGGSLTLEEADINLDVAYGLRALLAGDGAAVVMTRYGDEYKTNSDRYTFCNVQAADILISVHTNSTTNTTSDGSLALYFQSDERVLAQAVYDVMYPSLKATAPDAGNFTGFGLSRFASGVLLKSNMPAMIAEPLFMSNAQEAGELAAAIYGDAGVTLNPACGDCRRAQIAGAIHTGILSYFTVSNPGGGIVLAATATRVKGQRAVDLAWRGAAGDQVQVYRDGAEIAVTANDGSFTDSLGGRGGGTFSYRVCQADGTTCSNTVTVTF